MWRTRATSTGKRNYAILRLLWENGLRRGEIAKITCAEIDWDEQRITIYGKGRRDEGEEIDEARSRFGGDWRLVNGSP